jgi:hypothetical protein
MSALPKPSLIRQAYEGYLSAGFALVPVGIGKGPLGTAWNQKAKAWTRPEQIDDTVGVGIAHAWSSPVTVSFDIDNLPICAEMMQERGIDLQAMMDAEDAVQIESGNPGHAKLLFKTPFPMLSKQIKRGGKVVAEFRCSTANDLTVQDVLPSLAVHPKTGAHYRWAGKGHYSKLPIIPVELFNWWSEITEAETEAQRAATPAAPDAAVDLPELRSAIDAIDPDCDRRTWLDVGMGLALIGSEHFEIWNEWSKRSKNGKYPGEHDMLVQWRSFRNDKPVTVTVASIYHHATEHGWVRPPPDVTKLFKAVNPEEMNTAKEVVDRLDAAMPAPTVDLSLWPNVLVRRALEVSEEVGCDPVVPLLAGLAAVAAAVDTRTSLTINPTWVVPPTIWLMTIGEPSDKKTPGSKPMFAPLRKLENEDRQRFEAELLIWQGKEARHAAEMKVFRDWQASSEATFPGATPPMVTPLPPQPQPLRLTVQDATTQKIVTMSAGRPRGFLLYLDEMNRWFEKLADGRGTDDRGCWVHGYETGRYTMDRVGAGTIEVENMALSIYGNCQPKVFLDSIESSSKDGIMQRFLPAVLDSTKNKGWKDALPEFMSSAHDYEQMIRRTFGLQVMEYRFSPEALTVFKAFSEWTITLQRGEKLYQDSIPYQTALGKLDGQAARLIQLFHIIEDPHNPLISAATTIAAINVMKRYFVPAINYAFIEVANARSPLAKSIMMTLIQWAGERETVSLAEIRKLKGGTQSADSRRAPWHTDNMIRMHMDELATMKYVHLVTDHPRYPVWAINPALATIFADERREVIAAKAHQQGKIMKTVEERTGRKVTPSHPVIGSNSV